MTLKIFEKPHSFRQVSQLSKLCQIGEGTTGDSGAAKANLTDFVYSRSCL